MRKRIVSAAMATALAAASFGCTGTTQQAQQPTAAVTEQQPAGGTMQEAFNDVPFDAHQKDVANGETVLEKLYSDGSVEKTYMAGLGKYLIDQLGLKEYEQMIAETGAIPVASEERDVNQLNGDMGLNYIYLRNPLHLERLSGNDRALIANSSGMGEVSDEAMEVIIRTFPDVIPMSEIKSDADREIQTFYDFGGLASPNFVMMPTLVLNIATQSDYDENGNIVDDEKEGKKELRLQEIAEQMEDEMDGLLGETPVRVFVDFVK